VRPKQAGSVINLGLILLVIGFIAKVGFREYPPKKQR
jgi:hypothetical protein